MMKFIDINVQINEIFVYKLSRDKTTDKNTKFSMSISERTPLTIKQFTHWINLLKELIEYYKKNYIDPFELLRKLFIPKSLYRFEHFQFKQNEVIWYNKFN